MRVSIVVAAAENGVIGRDGKLPWHLADDLRRFKQLTLGHAIVMGRKTWESIGRPLPGRRSIIISRQPGYHAEGADVVASLEAALKVAESTGNDEAFVIGGAEIYRLAIPLADRLYLTRVHAEIAGDVSLPEFSDSNWQLVESHSHGADAKNDFPFSFEIYQRV